MMKMPIVGPSQVKYRVFDKSGEFKKLINALEEGKLSQDEWLKGVSCFVINERGEVLIEKRVNRGLTPGKLDLCSGHVDDYEVPTQSMIRELQEELGINWEESSQNLKAISGESPAPLRFESSGKKRNFLIYFFCLKRNSRSKVTFQEKEIDSISWISMKECFELIRSGNTKFPSDYNYEDIFKKIEEFYLGKNIGKSPIQK